MRGACLAGVVAVVLVAASLCGCRPGRAGVTDAGADANAAAGEAAMDARAIVAAILEAGPPDDAIPPDSSNELTERARHLLEAIAKDQADLATDILFPRDAWLGTRDAPDLGKDWDTRVAAPFRKGVHALWRRHHDLDRAQFTSLEVGHAVAQATPKRHGWKEPLWIAHGSRISYVIDGRTHTLPIRELTAWRGAWYVTRLR